MVNDNLLDFKMSKRLEKQLFCGTENTMDLLFIFFSDMKWEFWHNSLLPVCFSIKNFQVQKIRFWTMVGTLPPAPQVLRCRVLRLFLFQSRNSNSVCSWASAGKRANFVTFWLDFELFWTTVFGTVRKNKQTWKTNSFKTNTIYKKNSVSFFIVLRPC